MGSFLKLSKAFEESINELDLPKKYEESGGILTKEDENKLIKLIMTKTKGHIRLSLVQEIIQLEFSI